MLSVKTIDHNFISPNYTGNVRTTPTASCSHPIPHLDLTSVKGLYYSVKIRLFNCSDLSKRISALTTKEALAPDDISTIAEAFKSNEFPKVKHHIAKILAKLPPEDANTLLRAIFKAHALEDTKPLLQKLKSLFTLQKIEAAVQSEFGNFKGALDTALELSQTAKRTIDTKQQNKAAALKNVIKYYIMSTIEWFVDSIVLILQLTDVTDHDATKMEKQMVAQMRYVALRDNIAILSAWLIALTLYTGSIPVTALVTSAIGAVLVATYLIYTKLLKPCPEDVHPGRNRTADAVKGDIAPIYGREEIVKKLFDTLEGNTKTRARRYPMLRGGTGIGKSDLGNAMAMFLTSPDCPKEWKGKKLFVISTADIVTGGAHGKMEHLEHIRDVLEGHEKNAILFFTEVHVGFQEKTFFLGQELKTLCDAPGGFPYMVFATTDKEYMDYIAKDTAFTRRLELFDVKPTSDEVTELILSDMVVREAADILVSKEAIKEVSKIRSQSIEINGKNINVFENCPQPSTSIGIVAKVLANARHPWFKEHEAALQELKNQRDLLDHQLKLERGENYLPYSQDGKKLQAKLRNLDEQITEQEAMLSKATQELDQFRSLVRKNSALQEEIEKAAVKIKKSADKKSLSESELKDFILLLNFMKPELDNSLKELSQQVENANAVVNKEMMQHFIKEEAVTYLRKAQENEETKKTQKS